MRPAGWDTFAEPRGYSWPPTREDWFDFCDRAQCAPDSPHFLGWTPEELSERSNRESARKDCTPEIAAAMLTVDYGSA